MGKFLKINKISVLLFFLVTFGLIVNANALTIMPDTQPQWTLNDSCSNPSVYDFDNAAPDGITTLYKMNVGGPEEGIFLAFYITTFDNEPDGPKDATIVWEENPHSYISGDSLYLIVKDGNHDPNAYLFNLTALYWDGKETIALRNFWPDNGAISHVEIAGRTSTPVPEPATMLLLGTGLVGLAGASRKKFMKKS